MHLYNLGENENWGPTNRRYHWIAERSGPIFWLLIVELMTRLIQNGYVHTILFFYKFLSLAWKEEKIKMFLVLSLKNVLSFKPKKLTDFLSDSYRYFAFTWKLLLFKTHYHSSFSLYSHFFYILYFNPFYIIYICHYTSVYLGQGPYCKEAIETARPQIHQPNGAA